jgi:uncharacterized repeat protein (TIGR01451 family)
MTDGQYLLHYFAQDCAGTEELQFSPVGNGGWATSFFSVPINVDTVVPVVTQGPTLSPAPGTVNGKQNSYVLHQKVFANYACKDDASGIATCGGSTFASPGTLATGALSSTIDTSTVGSKTFTISTTDIAGNAGVPVAVKYNVVAAQSDLVLLQYAPNTVETGDTLSYDLLVLNLGSDKAEDVVITDHLPAGTSFVAAGYEDVSCALFGGCKIPAQASSCSFAGGTVSCNAGELNVLGLRSITGIAVRITVSVNAPKKSTLSNTASVQSADVDPNTGNNSSTTTTTVHK